MIKTVSVFLAFLLVMLASAYADTNASIFYGWNGTTFLPVLTDSSGKLQTDVNITTSAGMNPKTNNTINLGSLVRLWANIYTNSIKSGSTLSLFAGSTEAITILSSGYVGIGTTPTERLTIAGNISFTNGPKIIDDNGKLKFQAGGSTNGTTSSIYFLDSAGAVRGRFEANYSSSIDIVTFTDTNLTNFNPGTYNSTVASGENATFTSDFGDGTDGSITVTTANFVVNNYTNILHNATAGVTSINVTDNASFSVDDEILIIQMQNASAGTAGKYEYRRITSISNKTLSFVLGLANSYYNSQGTYNTSNSTVTQVVRIPQYVDVNVSADGSIVAPAWNGSVGGIIIFKATGVVNVTGVINASEKGFGGGVSGSTGPQYIKGRWTANGDNGDNSPVSASCTPSNIAGGNGGSCTLGVRSAGAATGGPSRSSGTGAENPGNTGLGSIRPVANATGGTKTYSGNYTIHTFTTNGTFNVTTAGTVEILVVAGGGGGGSGRSSPGGGGGGGGGVIYNSSFNVTIQNYTVVVGTGGPGSTALSERGKQGSNSSFDSLIAVGGGGGGSYGATNPGGSGGSGGGSTYGAAVGTGIAGQGYDGGKGTGADPLGESGGGGGGAGGVGANASTNSGGAGGTGVGNFINGSYAYYGGGGGGGTGYPAGGTAGAGGNGGGGAGGAGVSGTSATANTGGGGGGAGSNWPTASTNGGNGGSGIVIIRYATPAVSGGNAGGGGGSSGNYWNDASGAGGTGYEGGGGGGSYGYNWQFFSTGAGGGCPYKFDIADPVVVTTNDTSLINFGAGAPAGGGGGASSGSGGCEGHAAATAGTGGGANGSAGIQGTGGWRGYNGSYGGNGSSGGGIIIIHASNINAATSSILADGGPGGYGGNGTDAHSWSGGGGGGAGAQGAAGGTIKILSNNAALANNAVLARGGQGGKGGNSKGTGGGAGGTGASFTTGNDMGTAGAGGGSGDSSGSGWGGGGGGGNSGYAGKIIISSSNSSVSNPAAVNYTTSETYATGTVTDANITLNTSFSATGGTITIIMVQTGTGGTITNDGNYTVHTFTSNDTFTPPIGVTNVSVLVVAGGGGGGGPTWDSGGGGAGGLIYNSSFGVTTQNYTVVVGGGGLGGSGAGDGANGQNSSFGGLTAVGGGGGRHYAGGNGINGGSGGGGPGGAATTGGQPTAGQGYAGGNGEVSGDAGAGGGGGAGGVGQNGTSTTGGNGGEGVQNNISGSAVWYAGGGGGALWAKASSAVGGQGGGGAGNGTAGTPNTGGGGGATQSHGAGTGGNGGSGIVIVRYLRPTPVSYTVHTFTTNGTFNVTGARNVEVLVVAGGGAGGGTYHGGGGGAGGLIYNSSFSLTTQSYTVVVGGGGAGVAYSAGAQGSNSSFGGMIAIGGGGGSQGYSGCVPASNGGSGGGGGGNGGGCETGTSGIAGQGYRGGNASNDYPGLGGGGGGGAGGPGGNGNISQGGAGGIGKAYNITGTLTYYAGGGGGSVYSLAAGPAGAGGLGGGGNGSSYDGKNATANTGGGGGGAERGGPAYKGGSGGSGIVIVRYPAMNYVNSGNYTSRVFDAGQTVNWSFISWSNVAPAGTSIILKTRTSANNATFTEWMTHTSSPSAITQNSSNRYLQYQVLMNTTDASVTPYILNVSVNYTTTPVYSSLNTYGTLYVGTTNTAAADLAEYYATGEQLEAGDVVSVSNEKLTLNGKEVVTKGVLRKAASPYDSKLLGAISTTPGLILGSYEAEGKSLLALAGRTPVKVSAENGPIDIGDYLTSSSVPGVAMRATQPGMVIGRALEPLESGTGKIEVLVSTKESNFIDNIIARQHQIDMLSRQNQQIRERIIVLENAIYSKSE